MAFALQPFTIKPWLKPRVKSRTFYKRVVLVFREPPKWYAKSPVRVVTFDGRYWIETAFQHGAIQERVVREGWPRRHSVLGQANENSNLPVEMMNDGLHVVEFKVHNRMASSITGRVKSGATVCVGLYILWWLVSGLGWYIYLPVLAAAMVLAKIVLRGGIGNTGVAKQVSGVTSPFVITPYMLVRHVEGRHELMQQEGVEV